MAVTNKYHLGNFYNQIMKTSPVLYQYQYILQFVQGGGYYDSGVYKTFDLFDNDPDNPQKNFVYWAQSANIPAFTIPKAVVPFYGTEFRVPACMTYTHDFSTKIFLDQDFIMYDKMSKWLDMISRLQISGGGIKVIPTIKMRVKLLDSQHQYFTTSFVMQGAWLTELGKLGLDYKAGGGSPLTPDCKFRIQYYYRDDDCDLSMDPLSLSKIAAAYGTL